VTDAVRENAGAKPAGKVSPLSSPGQVLGSEDTAACAPLCAHSAMTSAPNVENAFLRNRDAGIELSDHIIGNRGYHRIPPTPRLPKAIHFHYGDRTKCCWYI
jgi:hypothetical protein